MVTLPFSRFRRLTLTAPLKPVPLLPGAPLERIPAVKGQIMSAYDPRSVKGLGVTYATSPQGADHTCGSTARGTAATAPR